MLRAETTERPADVLSLNILSNRGRSIRPKTLNQKRYVDSIDKHTITFGIGPAGTGKTYLAMAKAVQALQSKNVNRIILTRPAVEAGERLGFLPGTLSEKIDPYLRPLYDALHDMIDPESIPKLLAAGTIEVAPLAYMRGRAQPLDAKVLTPDGWRPIGDPCGRRPRRRVRTVCPRLCSASTRRAARPSTGSRTQDGASTVWLRRAPVDRCAHPTTSSHGRRPGRCETQEMVGQGSGVGHVRRYELPLVEPVEFVPQDVPLDPYALGLLLGDGCLTTATTPSFTTADPELADALEAALPGIELRAKGVRTTTCSATWAAGEAG